MNSIRRTTRVLLACACFILMAGCQQATQPDSRTVQNAQQDISDLNSQFLKAFNSKDPVAFAAVFSDDAVLMPPGYPAIKTQLAIQDYARQMQASSPVNGMLLNVAETVVTGDYAFCSGYYTLLGADGSSIDHGKFLEVLKNEGRDWKIFRDIYNSDMAAPAPAAPASPAVPATPAPAAATH
jgi:ketosteroid isomerase-like protein